MKTYLFVILIFLSSLEILGQGIPLKGKVRDKEGPVVEAQVYLSVLNRTVLTNTKGEFSFNTIPFGDYTLRVSKLGYATKLLQIRLNDKDKALDITLDLRENELDEITISGTLSQVKRSESPVPVEIYSHKFFQKNPVNNLFESVQMINGVLPTMNCNVCNTGDIQINGLDGPYTLVLIDGMPIVSSLSTVYGLMGIPNGMIEKVEVVKGPAATLYGSEAVGGLINVITKNPNAAPRLSVDYFTTSYLENNIDLGYSFRHKKVNYLLSGNYFHFNNRVDQNQDNFTDVSLQKRGSVFGKMQWNRKDLLSSSLAIRGFYEDRFGGEMQWTPHFRGGDSIYGESIFTKRVELIGLHPFKLAGQDFRLQVSANWHDQNSVYGNNYFLGQQGTAFSQLLHNSKAGAKHKILTGLAFRYQWYDDNTPATEDNEKHSSPSISYIPGAFVQDEWRLSAKHTVLSGLRIDYNNIHGLIFSPRINWKYNPIPGTAIRLSAGNGFRVVNLFTEDHAALSGARTVIVSESLKPEESWNINLQASHWFNFHGGYLELDGSLFYTYFSNKIIPDYDTDPNSIIYKNLEEFAVSKGFSLNANTGFEFPLKINTGITLMQVYTVFKDSLNQTYKQAQIHAPGFSGVFAISYTLKKWGGISIDYSGQVYGPMRLPILPNDFRPEYSPWYTLQNIQITKKWKNGIECYAGVKNLFNFMPLNPIMRPQDPFDRNVNDPISNPNGYTFDPTYNYAPLMARRLFMGIRYSLR